MKKLPYENVEIDLLILNSPDIITSSGGGGWDGPLDSGTGESNSDSFGWT